MKIIVTGATLPDGTTTDLLVEGTVITEVGSGLSANGATVIDANGLTALPGLVDLHTHLREPGFEQSETVLTGSRAAAIGGFTAIFAMANTSPVADTAGVVEQVASFGARHGYVTVRPIGAVTVGLAGKALSEIGAMAGSRAADSAQSTVLEQVANGVSVRMAVLYLVLSGEREGLS